MKNLNYRTLFLTSALLAVTSSGIAETDPVIAAINDFELRASHVNAQIAKMPLGDQVSVRSNPEKFAESLIQEEVLFQYVLQNSFTSEPELRNKIKTMAVNHLIDKYVTQKMNVSDAQIKNYYQQNTSAIRGETVQVSHILTTTRDECESIMTKLEAGEVFADLASQHSIHKTSASRGGELGSLMNHNGPLGFEPELFKIPQNHYSLFESTEGCHVVVVTGRDTPPLPPLENVALALKSLLLREQEIMALQSLIESAHQKIKVIRPQQSE